MSRYSMLILLIGCYFVLTPFSSSASDILASFPNACFKVDVCLEGQGCVGETTLQGIADRLEPEQNDIYFDLLICEKMLTNPREQLKPVVMKTIYRVIWSPAGGSSGGGPSILLTWVHGQDTAQCKYDGTVIRAKSGPLEGPVLIEGPELHLAAAALWEFCRER